MQLFRQVAVQPGIPAEHGFQRQAIDLRIRGRWVEGGPTSTAARIVAFGHTSGCQSEQTHHAFAPVIQKSAGGMRISVDDGGRSSDTLQPDRLPHHH